MDQTEKKWQLFFIKSKKIEHAEANGQYYYWLLMFPTSFRFIDELHQFSFACVLILFKELSLYFQQVMLHYQHFLFGFMS